MIGAGVLENPKVDAAMMIHVFTNIPVPSGIVAIPPGGVATAAADVFSVTVHGKGGHGAMPHLSVDPLNVIAHLHIALQEILAREIAPTETAALTIGQIHGGNAANVIPDMASLSGSIRSYSKETREFIKKRLEEIASSVAVTFRATATVSYFTECPSVINDTELVTQVTSSATELLGTSRVVDLASIAGGAFTKNPASEDFACITELVPGIMVVLSAGSTQEGYLYPQHHPRARFNEEILYLGAGLYANTAIEWLSNNTNKA